MAHAAAQAQALAQVFHHPHRGAVARSERGYLAQGRHGHHGQLRRAGGGQRLGGAPVQVGVARAHVPAARQAAAGGQLKAVGALRAHVDLARGVGRVGVLDVGALQVEQGTRHAQLAAQQVQLHANLLVLGDFRLGGRDVGGQRKRLGRWLERFAVRHVVRNGIAGLPHQPGAGAEFFVGAREGGELAVVARLLPVHVIPRPNQCLPLRGQGDLVLPIQRSGVLRGVAGDGVVGVVVGRRNHRRSGAGVEDGHPVGPARDGFRALLLLAQFHAHQPLLLEPAELVAPGHVGLVEHALFVAQDEGA